MARPEELLKDIRDRALKPHVLVNVARRFSQDTVDTTNVAKIAGTYTWTNYERHATQRIADQRVAQVNESVDYAKFNYELNDYGGMHTRLEKVAGTQFYIENVPAGATVILSAMKGYHSQINEEEILRQQISEGLNKIEFDEFECSKFIIRLEGLAGQIQYIRYAVPLGYADNYDDIQYNQVTPTINSGTAPVPMSQIRSFKFPNERFSQTYMGGVSNLRDSNDGYSATFEKEACSFSVYTDSWTLEDERMVCGIKLRASADLIARLTIVAWGYQPYNPTILADNVEFLQEIILWFPPTPACELDFFFEFPDTLPASYANKRREFLDTYCINIPEEYVEAVTPVTIESLKGTIPVINPSNTSALNVKPIGKVQGVSSTDIALSSAGSTASADAGTDIDAIASNVIDGQGDNTDWISWTTGWAWLEIDFNAVRNVTRLIIYYEYMGATDWVIEGLDETGTWVTIATESRSNGFWGEVTYDFAPIKLSKIKWKNTTLDPDGTHAIYSINAYEVEMVDAPLPVALSPVNRTVNSSQAVDTDLDETISNQVANWKLVFLGLKFSIATRKDYTIAIKHVPSGVEYILRKQEDTDETDIILTDILNLTSDFEIHVTTNGVVAGNTVDLVAITEDHP